MRIGGDDAAGCENLARYLIRAPFSMKIDASWEASAAQYQCMYRHGLIVKWRPAERHELVQEREEYRDTLDWELQETLLSDKDSPSQGAHRRRH